MENINFDANLAKNIGVNEAIFLQNIWHWIKKNKVDNKNFHDGKYWTYNSKRAYEEYYPFWTYGQIRVIIKNLYIKNLILIGNYSDDKRDKTNWYTLSDSMLYYFESVKEASKISSALLNQSIGSIVPTNESDDANPLAQSCQSFKGANNNTNNKTNSVVTLSFLIQNFPIKYDEFLLKYKSQILDFKEFEERFNLKLEEEYFDETKRNPMSRLESFARGWIQNQNKTKSFQNNTTPAKDPYSHLKAK